MGNTPGSDKGGIFTDNREVRTKQLLRMALISGNSTTGRAGVHMVEDEFRKAAAKSNKSNKQGVSGHDELVRLLVGYLTEEFKIQASEGPDGVPPTPAVLMADLSYPKTPLMHALDFGHMELANWIKAEITRSSKKQMTTTRADNGGDGGEEGEEPAVEFDRSALAKQRLMASQARTSNFKPKAPPPREIKSADSMMSEEEKAMFAKISAKMKK
ncbi:hypothetical protein TeGR_g7169 [Tetraparma gracilis]|uniref:LisH domain-containing protein n=1 Tax=Tetraparma gracilis TaxID=2962635 RepID=A0ABQ6MKV6_9STRA|nr:hypothetical protein TeGR_g7169 [Tetraparma gracilis]